MKKIGALVFIFVLMGNIAFGETIEEVEGYFQAGLQKASYGMIDEAISEFEKVVSSDPTDMEDDYYIQTYSESYFNIGLLKSKQEKWQEGIDYYNQALEILPAHKRANYYRSFNLLSIGEVSESLEQYNKALTLGYDGDYQMGDFVGRALQPYQERELAIEYKSYFDSELNIAIQIKGNPIGNDELMRDAIGAIERVSKISGQLLFAKAEVQYIRHREKATIMIEKWIVQNDNEERAYWVKYDFTPPDDFPYDVLIQASENEYF